jgi:NarL family two-component system response regulator LiaR
MLAPHAATKPITVVLVDHQPLYRAGLRQLLETEGVRVLGDVSTAEAGIELVDRHAPDVAIVDTALPGTSALGTIRRIAECGHRTNVLALASSASDADVFDIVVEGGSSYLLREAAVEQIVAGVHAAAAGDATISPQIATTLVRRLRASRTHEGPLPDAVLTEREKQVLRLVTDGKENDEIARELYISPHTVKNHISSILLKLKVANRIQAAVRAVRAAIV